MRQTLGNLKADVSYDILIEQLSDISSSFKVPWQNSTEVGSFNWAGSE